ncbi:hypothetical protein KC19_7G047900 [Ceratodon purpureus]|uniref:Uncharacterized protein n=1 Tax=Ceratodon purpureus TaxID=3225 RepID=A0A8T0HAU1_CERPU|nr:hypothetical protein KC19_7G047900 [Ceratodon purpureus]
MSSDCSSYCSSSVCQGNRNNDVSMIIQLASGHPHMRAQKLVRIVKVRLHKVQEAGDGGGDEGGGERVVGN